MVRMLEFVQAARYSFSGGVVVRRMALVLALGAAACGGSPGGTPAAGGQAGGAMPPMPVEITTLEAKPIDQTTELVATIRSRRSTTVQPQAEGIITKIAVKSGDRVAPGAPILDIDAGPQRAAVAVLEGLRGAREADAIYAKQQAERAKALLEVGASSQQEYDQAVAQQRAAEAQLKSVDDQIRQQQAELDYYHVVAPTGGVVGDMPVREGDRVTKSTVLTTIDGQAGSRSTSTCPCSRRPSSSRACRCGSSMTSGTVVSTERINFISPSVDDSTQTVLVKAPVPDSAGFRPDQFVRVRIVWSTEPGLTVPVTAVNRINGQFFVFVAEKGERGLTAHQRPVALGAVIGNEYVVQSGLKPGDQLDRVGVAEDRRRRAGPGAAAERPRRSRRRRCRCRTGRRVGVLRIVHSPADPRDGLLAADHSRGRDLDSDAADRALSGPGAARGGGHGLLHRRQRAATSRRP